MAVETAGDRYALDGRLGEGGQGCVYRARHLQLGKAFVLKVISPAFALDAAARKRFNEEAKLASEITHPNIESDQEYRDVVFTRAPDLADAARADRAQPNHTC